MTQKFNEILMAAVERRASDTHFSADECIWMRLDGDLERFGEQVYTHAELEQILLSILSEKERERLKAQRNLDKSYFIPEVGNFRVNIFYTRRGVGAVVRTLPSKMPSLENLGLPAVVKALAELPKGLILVTGPTGSGKSTTLAAIIDYMNENFGYHILTVEDPVEFIHKSKKSLVNQREIGQSCPTFADALKYALREDPDVILVGEMRDIETISLAMTAAETGHLVLGTLHTRGAASTMDRIIETFPGNQQSMARAMLAESLQAVISQTLLKKADGTGRVAVYEIMVMNWAISNLVREGKTFQVPSIIQTGKREGMILMEAHARELLAAGEVLASDAEALIAQLSKGNAGASKPASAPPSMTAGGKTDGGGTPPTMKGAPPKMAVPSAPAAAKAAPAAPPRMETPKPAPTVPVAPPPAAVAPEPVAAPAPAALQTTDDRLLTLSEDEGMEGVNELEIDMRDLQTPPAPPMPSTKPVAAPPPVAPMPSQTIPTAPPVPAMEATPPAPAAVPPLQAVPTAAKPGMPPAPPLRSGLPPPPPPKAAPAAAAKPLPLPIKKTG